MVWNSELKNVKGIDCRLVGVLLGDTEGEKSTKISGRRTSELRSEFDTSFKRDRNVSQREM